MTSALAFRVDPSLLVRGILAGLAWGLAMSAGFLVLAFWQCGTIPCPDEMAFNAGACVATGLLTMGPLSAFGGQSNP